MNPNPTHHEMLTWIDNASTEELLHHWRFAPAGDPFFAGEVGDYFSKVIAAHQAKDPAAWTAASKKVGWDLQP